jgi:hypothetical protein
MNEKALIGSMKDGLVKKFNFRGLQIVAERGFVKVVHPDTNRQLGGKVHMERASVKSIYEWLENKSDLYEVKA